MLSLRKVKIIVAIHHDGQLGRLVSTRITSPLRILVFSPPSRLNRDCTTGVFYLLRKSSRFMLTCGSTMIDTETRAPFGEQDVLFFSR